ncbi:MAG: chemotaxis protein [Butyrivibrio sp.]|nr:chemotaxis protein [Butyrivibrio sp.]
MPKGEPKKSTIRTDKYQKKAGYKVKGFKLKGDVAERFEKACEAAGVSQASKITELMEEFIKQSGGA